MEIPDYEENILNYPLVLLDRIRLLMHTPIRATYRIISLSYVMSRLVNLRQKENGNLLYYFESFKEKKNIAKIQLGKQFLDPFTKKKGIHQTKKIYMKICN